MCLCPGKRSPLTYHGSSDRDLAADLYVLMEWGASAVLTLLEEFEFDILHLPDLTRMGRRMGMKWFHLPITDGCPPGYRFEGPWLTESSELHNILEKGGKILVHCGCGIGRAGTVAAQILIERGMPVEDSINTVRAARPGAIENLEQENYLRTLDL